MFAHIGPEALLISLALLIALVFPELAMTYLRKVENQLARIAQQRRLAIVICGASALALRLLVMFWLPIPHPAINDEFSFLLAGDTFAHGRLANPMHPMWIHFETFHAIFHPTYASMYPPLQGLALAFGQVVFGHPFWGVWLSAGLMCSALCWMLQSWMAPQWAFLGGMLPALRFGVFSYWDNSYWGGALAAAGGALLLGGMRRIMRTQRACDAIIMSIGIAMLVNTRPYEGLVLTFAVIVILILWMIRSKRSASLLLRRLALPMLLVLGLAGAGTSYYFWRVTGHPLEMPQQLNRETYAVARYFYWQTAYAQSEYHHKAIRDFYVSLEADEFKAARTIKGIMRQAFLKVALPWVFYVAPILTPALLFLPCALRSRRIRLLVIAGAVGFLASCLVVFFNLHYLAPIVPVMIAVLVQGIRHLRLWRFEGKPSGLFLSRAMVALAVIMIPMQISILRRDAKPGTESYIGPIRAAFIRQLETFPERQLVLVRYASDHRPELEWVYNLADIDSAKVVWARDMGPTQNAELFHYYADRRVWVLEGDAVPPKLTPYSADEAQPRAVAEEISKYSQP